MKKYLFITAGLCFLGAGAVKAQTLSHGQQVEKTLSYWASILEQVRVAATASQDEFAVFQRFYAHTIDSVYSEFTNKILSKTVASANVNEYMQGKKPFLAQLFNSFRKVEQDYPSSVSEYKTEHRPRIGMDTCFSSCYNTGFENGTFNGWYGYYGINSSVPSGFSITGITGGYLGAVSKAAFDPNTSDYQLRITSGAATDRFLNTYSTYTMPQVSPWGGTHSVMMGDSNTPLQGVAILSQTFQVTAAAPNLTLEYSLFLENPLHQFFEQPFFTVAVLDHNGDTIPICGEFLIGATNHPASTGFKSIYYPAETDTVYWLPWTLQNVPLKNYIGQCITVVFQVQDCSLGGHFGYAYVDASCSTGIIASSPNICGNDSVSLTAPPVGVTYFWTGPSNGIRSNDSLQTIWVDSAGTYTVVCIPATGPYCADTLTITIGKSNNTASLTASASPTLISVGDSSLLTAICSSAVSFAWSPSGSVTYPDSSQSYAHPAVTTTYTVTAATPCGIISDTVTVFVTIASGINSKLNTASNLNIFPNPNNGMVNISYSLSGNGTVQFTIVDELGQAVYDNTGQKTAGTYTEQLNLENLASGIYSLRVQTNNSITVKKLVVMKK